MSSSSGRALSSLAVAGVLLFTPGAALAQVFDSGAPDYEPPEPERRYGFSFGLGFGVGYGDVLGYPNKLGEIGEPEFAESVSGLAFGNQLWIGGTLRDWFTFGLGLSSRGTGEGERTAQNGAFVLHIEGFPLYALGGEWRDVGLFTEVGAGGGVVLDEDGEDLANGGIVSVAGIGVFYEPWQFWHFSVGPSVQYMREFSQSWSSDIVTLGIRTAFYGVQP